MLSPRGRRTGLDWAAAGVPLECGHVLGGRYEGGYGFIVEIVEYPDAGVKG